MDKRYQVFVSSTFADLKDERGRVIQTLMEMDCIPAGMELFPAADEEQLAFIKRVIDDCDYYIVIVGARYGSVGADGVSYTEKEYEYALERGLRVIALLHEDPESLPMTKSEADPAIRARLETFRRRLADGRLVRFWRRTDELPGLVALSLNKTIKMFPALGWVRAGEPSAEVMHELLDLRRRAEAAQRVEAERVRGADAVGLCRAVSCQGDFGTESDWLELLNSSVERVDLLGRALYGWAESNSALELISKKIKQDNIKFRWLVMAPDNQFLGELTEGQMSLSADLRSKVDTLRKALASVRAQLPIERRDRLQLRYFSHVPLYFAYIRVDDRFFVTQYLWTLNASSSPMYCLKDIDSPWAKAYSREFEMIWEAARDSHA